ncbi:hypothetical protein IVB18_22425 [Bradyrhizobium sp. 186]|uniref:hypothetical protein n=1 Tax=Bradyrhizobium sp. 186 TaxID=2782654 RepID=UPI0020019BAB|nr:hypothetical protein [Bradyrhizobium sp. 186]UPK39734.1 hypothetical protein IVB18_22425 [Bradyrhizobium sp. 186]
MGKQQTVYEKKQELEKLLAEITEATQRARDAAIGVTDADLKRQIECKLDEMLEHAHVVQQELDKTGIG